LLRGFLFEPTIKVLIAETQISTSTFRVKGLIRHSALPKASNLDSLSKATFRASSASALT
jgi:hypothetical protein